MNKRVIYSYFNDSKQGLVIKYLWDKHGWDPVFFHSQESMRGWSKERFPDSGFHSETAMRQSDFDYTQVGKPAPIDAEIISALSNYESNCLSWMEDTTRWNFSFFERRTYYYDVLKYWNAVIQKFKPNLFICYTWPHCSSDYPLYLLCKHYYEIPVLFLFPAPMLENGYYFIASSMENVAEPFDRIYLSNEYLELSEPARNHLDALRSNNPQIPKAIEYSHMRLDIENKKRYMNYINILRMVLSGRAFKKSNMAFKKNKKPWDSDDSKLTYFDYFIFRERLTQVNHRLKKIYEKMVEPADLDKKYIYFPAPYQPEVTSNIIVGIYEDIFLVLDMISEIIPEDWLIYYKEHPHSFKKAAKGGLMRDNPFYLKVGSYKNVRMVSSGINTFELIDNSQAVCTIGGTAAWEAAVRSKPVMLYGSTWHQGCKSIFVIKTFKEAVNAVNKIVDGFIPDRDDVDRYAEAVYRSCVHGLISANFFSERISKCPDPEYTMELLGKAFYDAYELYYGSSN